MQQRKVLAVAAATVAVLGTTSVAAMAVSGAGMFGGKPHQTGVALAAVRSVAGTPTRVVTRTEFDDQRVVVTTPSTPTTAARGAHSAAPSITAPASTSTEPGVAGPHASITPAVSAPAPSPTHTHAKDPQEPISEPSPTVPPEAPPTTQTTAPVTSTTPPTTTAPVVQTIDTSGGVIHAETDGVSITITSVDAAPGVQVETSVSGTRATVHFESRTQEYEVYISLSNGQLTWHYGG
jgi:hypothetical protein